MCENIFYFLKLHVFCFLIIVSLIIFSFSKRKEENSEEKSKLKFFFDFIKEYIIYISSLLVSLFILFILVWINSRFLNIISDEKIEEALGLIISATITVSGVFVGYYFNKRQTYKEIVTRERIEWLHKMQEALAEFLAKTSEGSFEDKEEVRKLYYLIISNLNVKEDKEKKNKNERDAVELLFNYANSMGLDVELNFYRNVDCDENKDANGTISLEELKEENENLKDQIETLQDKIKSLRNNEEVDPLAVLKRKEIISQYTEIFNETWNRIKNEAD